MASAKQHQANRNNAQRSTGPKSPAGKARAAQNAFQHGLTTPTPSFQPLPPGFPEPLKAALSSFPAGPTSCPHTPAATHPEPQAAPAHPTPSARASDPPAAEPEPHHPTAANAAPTAIDSPNLESRLPLVPEADRLEFFNLAAELLTDSQIQSAHEHDVFAQLLWSSWQLRRARRYEAHLLDQLPAPDQPLDPALERRLALHARYAIRWERSYYRALTELRRLQSARLATQTAPVEVQDHATLAPLAAAPVIEKLASFGRKQHSPTHLEHLLQIHDLVRQQNRYPTFPKDPAPPPPDPR